MVKDNTIKMREELTEEEVGRWGTAAMLAHIKKKQMRESGFGGGKDELFIAVSKEKFDFSKIKGGKKEKGIKI